VLEAVKAAHWPAASPEGGVQVHFPLSGP
jgi:hypothetical protein